MDLKDIVNNLNDLSIFDDEGNNLSEYSQVVNTLIFDIIHFKINLQISTTSTSQITQTK